MKIVLIIAGGITVLFTLVQIFAFTNKSGIESYPYEVLEKYDEFEIRKYEASLFSTVKMSTNDYKMASSNGFRILAGYIFGGNQTNEKIAMTTPVSVSLEDSMTVSFMVPKEYSKETLPSPNAKQIRFQEEPVKTVAAITFSGWANNKEIEKYKSKLIQELESNNIQYSDKFYFLGYNPPYDVVDRRNEVIVELIN